MEREYDLVVVGGGNAAFCAALSAQEAGARVLVLEGAPYEARGGNTAFTAGAMRVAYRGVDDILALVPDLTPQEVERTDFGTYEEGQFFDDLGRVTQYRTDPDLAELLVSRSFETLAWMRGKGVRFLPIYGRQAFQVNGRFTFWGGLTLEVAGGGPGLVDYLTRAARQAGIDIEYRARATDLVTTAGAVTGVRYRQDGLDRVVRAKSVVLGCGGFEANPEWRARYLGPGWDLAKVRGTRFNQGDGIRMALAIGAMPAGHWSGAHAVAWDYNAPTFGDIAVGDGFQKHSYPFGIMVNTQGRRFLDEGADFRNYTYAKYGHEILAQPNQCAWQIFDQKVTHLLRDEYRIKQVTKATADSIEELAAKLDGIDAQQLVRTVAEYNRAVQQGRQFDPNVKDGRRTVGLSPDKTNWANTLDTPPYEAYAVTCGVTFTFGGLKIDTSARVLDTEEQPIPGLFACGELVGGLFYFNYPGGTGLTSGAVFGRIAGASAASWSQDKGQT